MFYVSLMVTLRISLIVKLVKNSLQCWRPRLDSWVGKIRWRRDGLPTPVFLGLPCGSAGKKYSCNFGDLGLKGKATHSSVLAWRIPWTVRVRHDSDFHLTSLW